MVEEQNCGVADGWTELDDQGAELRERESGQCTLFSEGESAAFGRSYPVLRDVTCLPRPGAQLRE